jgi:alpha-L-fucosidase
MRIPISARLLLFFVLILNIAVANAQQKMLGTETAAQKEKRMEWWSGSRFGMFIHWGIYSNAARHEWVKRWERMNDTLYQPYFDNFDPDLFNPKDWAKKAKAAGMKYAVLTTKHHDGFCLFDSKYTNYKSTKTLAGRDLVREWVEAFRAEGLKVGFYYSLIDWHHPDFIVDAFHPLQPASESEDDYTRLNKGRDWNKYKQYLHNQIRELLTGYGKIDIMWLDFSYPNSNGHGKGKDDWGSVELLKMIRKLQPNILVDNRLDLESYKDGADFATPEQVKPSELQSNYGGLPFETCQTFSGSWGYYRDENTWKTNHDLLTLLITSVSKSGNLILNVGPTGRGTFDTRAEHALDSIASWMKFNNKAIYGCKEAPKTYSAPPNSLLTFNPRTNRLYLHLLNYSGADLLLSGFQGKIKYAQFLHDHSEIRIKKDSSGDLFLQLPALKPAIEIPVVELMLTD